MIECIQETRDHLKVNTLGSVYVLREGDVPVIDWWRLNRVTRGGWYRSEASNNILGVWIDRLPADDARRQTAGRAVGYGYNIASNTWCPRRIEDGTVRRRVSVQVGVQTTLDSSPLTRFPRKYRGNLVVAQEISLEPTRVVLEPLRVVNR